ncbi:MAG: hypothetical protein E6I91_21790 [Chloroflexi bacterium]|nr:MAG: hypothetical protein E6I91_21790 [Chloroflexota bacterium]
MQPSTPEPEKRSEPAARPDLLAGFYQHFASKRQILLVLMDRLLQEASMLTLEAKSAALPDIRDGIARLVRQALAVDWAYAGAYRAWREARCGIGNCRRYISRSRPGRLNN